MKRNMSNMNNIMMKLFMVIMLMMFSMGAYADVKVLFGENGDDVFSGKGGTIEVSQEPDEKDETKVKVYLTFIPNSGYAFEDTSLKVYAVASPDAASTRSPQISGDPLKLTEEKTDVPSAKRYSVDIDSKLALWVKEANFLNGRKNNPEISFDPGFSGMYYIGSRGYTKPIPSPNTNYYLCPTEGWAFYVATNTVTGTDNGQPFLTTYQCRDDVYDARKAIWTLVKHPTETDCYYIVQTLTGKYVVSNGTLTGSGSTRARVHLETVADDAALTALGDKALFEITIDNNHYDIKPHSAYGRDGNNIYLVVNTNNYNQLDGNSIKKNGPTGFPNCGGIIGLYTHPDDGNAYFYLEEIVTRPTITLDASSNVTLTAESGTTIRYTTDGTNPTATTGTVYDTAFPIPYGATAIKAVAVKAVNSVDVVSKVATLPLPAYTYNIVDTEGHIAIKCTVNQLEGLSLSNDYTSIPEAIRSPYLAGETVTFYSTFTEGSRSNLSNANAITETPAGGGDIYVSYTTDHINDNDQLLRLSGSSPFTIQVNGQYVYDSSGSLMCSDDDNGDADDSYRWQVKGGDPYRMYIQNVKNDRHYLKWNTDPSVSLVLTGLGSTHFIIFGGSVARPSGVPEGFKDQVEFMAATGADLSSDPYYNVGRVSDGNVSLLASDTYGHENAAVQVLLKTMQKTTTFHIIDMSGRIVVEQSGFFDALDVPSQWKSPLVQTYHFYEHNDFRVHDDVYTLRSGVTEIPDFDSAPEDIYVTYEPNDTYDLDGSENRATDGKKYLLKFAGGTSFQQEKSDGFEATAAPGIYPYINGEGGLFVYGQDKLDETEGAVGSTRTRWAWYLEGGDPYRLRISSLQTKTDGVDDTRHSYLRTYKPQGYTEVVTGVISNNPKVSDGTDGTDPTGSHDARHTATDYMILNGTNGHLRLVTSDVVDDLDGNAANDVRHTVTSFENYWKTNPTAANVIHAKDNTFNVGDTPTDEQITAALTTGEGAKGWHTYNVWANGSTWTSSSKKFDYIPHWFLTIDVGTETAGVYNGDFDLVEYELDGALILLDQHGWEVMRKPITNLSTKKESYASELRKYDSPMVRKYHFWTKFIKEDGYHKYKPIRGKEKESDNAQHKGTGTSLSDYPEVFSTGTLADIYVTYEVMATYCDGYTGAATEAGTNFSNSKYLIRQGANYAKTTDGVNITLEDENNVDLTAPSSIGNELLWYLKPNFNIDTEMGYNYSGSKGEKTQAETESAYFSNTGEDAVYDKTNGQNGFDPYNLQIESVAESGKLFTTNAIGTALDGSGGLVSTYGDSKTVTLQTYAAADPFTVTDYYDLGTGYQTLHVTNSTFMAVSDDNGNIRLMPRFDHHNVQTSFTTLDEQEPAKPYGDEDGTQTTLFVHPSSTSPSPSGDPIEIDSSDEITDMNGYYILKPGFTITKVIGTSDKKPFTGIIDGQLNTIDGVNRPLVAYADGATIKNVIIKTASINAGNADGNAGAICCEAKGATRIYNCGILPTTTVRDKDGNITGFTGSHVSGSVNVGGIVGKLSDNARVINCFSYATIMGGSGCTAGIVGNIGYGENESITQATVGTKPMVVNCMFYGEITSGSNIAPVYGGASGAMIKNDANDGVNPYCYFRKNATFDNSFDKIDAYKRSWPAEEKNLTRFEYYRSVLNSNRRLCTWWVNGTNEVAPTDADVSSVGIAKWVVDPEMAPYPILKVWGKYPSIINPDPVKRTDPSTKAWVDRDVAKSHWETHAAPDTDGQILGEINVSINAGDHHTGTASKNINITAMDKESFDYCYGKIQLPYYNEIFGNPDGETWSEKYGDNYGEYVVTGWEITSVTGGTPGTFVKTDADGVKAWESGFNFADRKCTDKDKYDVSGRVFAQGGYYYVPEGVSAITIKAHWGKAFYLANREHSIDRVNLTKPMTADNNNFYKVDKPFAPAGTVSDKFLKTENFAGYTVYNDLQEAIKALGKATVTNGVSDLSVYDQAIVLIGNHQVQNASQPVGYDMGNNHKQWHPFTIMSADFDFDNEPDNCLELQFRRHTDRPGIQPIRFDFLPVVELGLAVRPDKNAYAIGVFIPQGHFEITETSFMRTTQFEWDCGQDGGSYRVANNVPVILNGGEFDQLTVRYGNGTRTGYFLVGGHLWFHRFAPGAHPHKQNNAKPRLCVVNAIGGDFPEFYLSGLYKPNLTPIAEQGNPHCYIDGGNFGYIYGAGYDKVNGDVTFKVNHSLIGEFYGGGINGSNPVGGNIDVTIDNSLVTKYCGGPKVGSMAYKENNVTKYKTVTTHATGTIFGVYYGGGNGGNSYYRQLQYDGDVNSNTIGNWKTSGNNTYNWDGFNPLGVKDDSSDNKGYHAEYEFEVFNQSNGLRDQITKRGFIKWIQFGITTTGNVSNTLTDCTINTNFFGGGNLATVNGTVTSTLTNTKVKENVFGAGYSASIPTFTVQNKESDDNPRTPPSMDFAGTITDGYIPNKKEGNDDIEYEWTNELDGEDDHDAAYMKDHPAYQKTVVVDGEEVQKWYCYTWNSLANLGAVLNQVTLTLDGDSKVGTEGNPETGNVYGGGDASAVGRIDDKSTQNVDESIIANTTVNLQGNTQVLGNVFGGGNEGLVNGSATVNIRPETPTTPTPSPSRASNGSSEGTGEGSSSGN